MSLNTIDHVLLTRFNVPSAGRESLIRAQESWLRDRVALFEKYCLPSVLQQSVISFNWIIYFDPQSPPWLREWIDKLAPLKIFHPIFRESVSNEQLVSDLRHVSGATAQTLLTTNLDNDDSLAVDFVEQVQSAVGNNGKKAIYLANGLILQYPSIYLQCDKDNAFCSVAEPWDTPVTAWADWHNRLHMHMPVSVVYGPPAWVQVVHGTNVSNRVHGRLDRPSAYRARLAVALVDLPEPRPLKFATEAFVARPFRSTAWQVRSLSKDLVIRVLGRKGLESARDIAAGTTHRFRALLASAKPARSLSVDTIEPGNSNAAE